MKIAVVAFAFVCSAFVVSAQVKVGEIAPEISLKNAKDSLISLSSFRGKVVLVDFWASWCGPCRAANPSVVKLYNKYRLKGFEVFGVSIDNKRKAWLTAVKQDKIKYTQVNDSAGWNSKVGERYGINEIPASFLLDKTGKIVAVDLDGTELENKVIELLK